MSLGREVVACVLTHDDACLLLRRSRLVGSDAGRWHCVTGYCEPGVSPLAQALVEVAEETGVHGDAVRSVRQLAPVVVPAPGGAWTVHPFQVVCADRDVVLDWEHDDLLWTTTPLDEGLDTVPWLAPLLRHVVPGHVRGRVPSARAWSPTRVPTLRRTA